MMNNKKHKELQADLLVLTSKLWDELSTTNLPMTTSALWKEHQHIRMMLDKIDQLNPPNVRPRIPAKSRARANQQLALALVAEGAQLNGIKIVANEAIGADQVGLVTTREVKCDDIVAKMPRQAMLSYDDAKNAAYLKEAMLDDPMLSNMHNVALSIFLLCERHLGDESRYKLYIDSLPREYSTPLYYSEQQMQLLRPSPAFDVALKMYRAIVRQFAYFHVLLATAHIGKDESVKAKRLGSTPLNIFNFTFDDYRWAVSTIATRMNNVPSQVMSDNGDIMQIPALIPLLDLANHDDALAPEISVFFDTEMNCACIASTRDYDVGQPFLIYYGRRSDIEHLCHNGFVTEGPANASYALKLGISPSDKCHKERVSLLESYDLEHRSEVFDLAVDLSTLSQRLLTYARIFVYDFDAHDKNRPISASLDCHNNTLKAVKFIRDRLNLIAVNYDRTLSNHDEFVGCIEKSIETLLRKENSVVKYTIILCDKMTMNITEVLNRQKSDDFNAKLAVTQVQMSELHQNGAQ